jgi:hypothetical protein
MSGHNKLLSIDTGQCTQSHNQLMIVKTYPNSNLKESNIQVRQFRLNYTKYFC